MGHWHGELRHFFESRSAGLCEILDAGRCREGWIQGEMFRWFRRTHPASNFEVNRLNIGPGKTADFSAEQPVPLVGEIKIIGCEFLEKCITGGRLGPALDHLSRPITSADRFLKLGPWGLIPDYFRLIDFAQADHRVAYLVLIADMRNHPDWPLGLALRAINFDGPSDDIEFAAGLIRIWTISHVA